MDTSSVASDHDASLPQSQSQATTQPITLDERHLTFFALVRILFGLVWFQQLSWKTPPNFDILRSLVELEGTSTFLPGYSWLIQNFFLPNIFWLGVFLWSAELIVSISLLFGLFTRFGAILAFILSLQLFVGIAYAPDLWHWSYGMMMLLSLILIALPTGRRLGIDQWLVKRFETPTNRLTRFVRWLI